MQNRLAKEKSPYLLQHANNPVDWYPWGEEAFEEARKKDKPIFLSIGYATCHWCHVMEKESFENQHIAEMMNDVFVCIKVDREELPHIDNIYMDFAQALLSSSGGWPLNVILTPDLKPFFAITYLPAQSRKGLIGLDQFILHIQKLWQSEEKGQLVEQASRLVEIFKESFANSGIEVPSSSELQKAIEMFFELTDPVNGGLKGEPKFPLGYLADLLLSYGKKQGDSRAIFYVELTLQMMHRGGIYDHIGGGFSRYTVDAKWIIPHFEKMLYDNAILAKTYLDAWKYTHNPLYKTVCCEVIDYVLRDMIDKEGGFYSAEDADSEGKEGLFYTWTIQEIEQILEKQESQIFCGYYSLSTVGNFEGRNVLHVAMDLNEFAKILQVSEEKLSQILDHCRKKLFEARSKRPHPFKDDKIITAWNGLMIDTLVQAGVAMQDEKYAKAALASCSFIVKNLLKDGHLLRRYRDADARFAGNLDDYAFFIKAILSLFESGFGSQWLELSLQLTKILEEEFKVPGGAFYLTHEDENLVFRKCEFYDGAEPSGNAVHCENLLRLYQITQEEKYLQQAEDILKAAKAYIDAYPPGASYNLLALQRYLDHKAPTVIIALNEKGEGREALSRIFFENYFPSMALIWKEAKDSKLMALIPALQDKMPVEGKTAVYICRQDGCEAPLTDLSQIEQALQIL